MSGPKVGSYLSEEVVWDVPDADYCTQDNAESVVLHLLSNAFDGEYAEPKDKIEIPSEGWTAAEFRHKRGCDITGLLDDVLDAFYKALYQVDEVYGPSEQSWDEFTHEPFQPISEKVVREKFEALLKELGPQLLLYECEPTGVTVKYSPDEIIAIYNESYDGPGGEIVVSDD